MTYLYLLFDAEAEAILAECESAQDALEMMKRLEREQPHRKVSIALLAEHRGEVVGTRAVVTARALSEAEGFALYGRHRG